MKDLNAVALGSKGGKKTRETHDDEFYLENQRKAVKARLRNKRLLKKVVVRIKPN